MRIVAAEELGFQYESTYQVCGYNYQGLLRYSVAGSFEENLTFFSEFQLGVGDEYIVVVGHEAPPVGLSVNWPEDYERAFHTCESSLRGEHLGEDQFFRIETNPMNQEGDWLRVYDDSVSLGDSQVILSSDIDGLEFRLVPLKGMALGGSP